MARDERKRLIGAARRMLSKDGGNTFLATLVDDLFTHVALEDLCVYSAREIAAFARSAAKRLGRRLPERHEIRIGKAELPVGDDRHDGMTLIEIVNDNMPFLVDTVLAELQETGAEIHLVAHPIVNVERDAKGRLKTYFGAEPPTTDKKAIRESLIQIHVTRLTREEDQKALVKRLDKALTHVRLAVADWSAMRRRLRGAIDDFQLNQLALPREEVDEAVAFLEWLEDNNFTFLGIREYDFVGGKSRGALRRADQPGLGILRDPSLRVLRRGRELLTTTPAIRDFLMRPEALIVTKANVKSTIHRHAYLDYIGIKRFTQSGRLAGELRLVGLFTSTAYTRSIRRIPYLRRKADRVIALAGFDPGGHSGKALANVLESYPRDELFQIDDETLFEFAIAILRLSEHPRVRVLARRDKFDRFVSVIVFVPRERYNTGTRIRIGNYLETAFDGHVSAHYPAFPEGPLARVHYIIGRRHGETPNPPQDMLEASIVAIVRTWADQLARSIADKFAAQSAARLSERYSAAFSLAYQEDFSSQTAVEDIERIDRLTEDRPLAVVFYRSDPQLSVAKVDLKLIHLGDPIALSRRVPILEHMGFHVIDERTYDVEPDGERRSVFVHDMTLEVDSGREIDLVHANANLTACFLAVWYGDSENDGYNALVVNAGLEWRDIALLRAVSRFLRQAGSSFSQDYMWESLNRHADIGALLVELFHARFDPSHSDPSAESKIAARIEAKLETVESLDEDRIIRRFVSVVRAMLRTNFFQPGANGRPRIQISFKLDSALIEALPQPRPFREIFVHSPRVDGVHLRFGTIARGGIRWSDRQQDFRTEILGLAKAQNVKNVVIVPVGAKGGFVAKQLPVGGGRDEVAAEGVAAYKIFISSLLDMTDNLDGEKLIPPERVVRHDGDDPYLVVAADKGTATFSDIANGISTDHDFWLGDAFASGGSAGYDHKKMGITARGAWEAVKRHFRELDRDIQSEPFTVIGVGDMSGDVFGNGMLLSPAIKLVGAFDHRDIFIDPDPDPEAGLAERQRLFDLPRSSWQDYDRSKISAGGGVFSRREKAIRLSPQMKSLLETTADRAPPNEVIRAILKARVDLLWFGGIGTYVKAPGESDDMVGDRGNDAIRITTDDLGAAVVGEGANLGMTQNARIAFGLAGGRCNTDAIDNSAGVNTSDVEVNIKVALASAMRAGRLDQKKRNRLLATMTKDVAALVLRNNYLQPLAISLSEGRGFEEFGFQVRLMRELEGRGLLDRAVETLPDDAELAERQKSGEALTRAEIAVLLAYAKIVLFDDLIASDVVDDPALTVELVRYFPKRMQKDYAREIETHRLRREIIAAGLANSMINRGGSTYLVRMADLTGAGVADIARAYFAVRDSFRLQALHAEIDELDNRVAGSVQMDLYRTVQDFLFSRTAWFLRNASFVDGVGPVVAAYSNAIANLVEQLTGTLPPHATERSEALAQDFVVKGVPHDLARRVAVMSELANATDIYLIAEDARAPLASAAGVFFAVAEYFRVSRIESLARALPVSDYYDGLALDQALEKLHQAHRRIATKVVAAGGAAPFETWLALRREAVERTVERVVALTEDEALTVSRVTVAANLLADMAGI